MTLDFFHLSLRSHESTAEERPKVENNLILLYALRILRAYGKFRYITKDLVSDAAKKVVSLKSEGLIMHGCSICINIEESCWLFWELVRVYAICFC